MSLPRRALRITGYEGLIHCNRNWPRVRDGGARFMAPIMTGPLCLTCHGAQLSPAVKAALAKDYPGDQATGFKAGDLRGAFSIVWPAHTAPAAADTKS